MGDYTLGIVGQGFVGNAFREGMRNKFRIETYDKYVHERSTCKSIKELVNKSCILFVSVPTPMRKTGECDLSIIESVFDEIYDACYNSNEVDEHEYVVKTEVVIRSTVSVGSTDTFNRKYGARLSVLFNPEFLTEMNAISDFKNQNRVILGIANNMMNESFIAEKVYAEAFPDAVCVKLPAVEAELVKYTTNVFLAVKVSLANELWQVCRAVGANYDRMIDAAKLDKRLGQSHWMVPGPPQVHDERRLFSWGGHCLPKDLNSLRYVAQQLGVKPTMMMAAWDKCLEMRPSPEDRDWEFMAGRAVSEA